MATKEEDLTLEASLNKATNPANREEDWDEINHFCELVNKDLEGPNYAVRLLAHKVQSPIEREALFALSIIEACVKSCGKRFHQEIGKFRFLNEVIKVISPKYLGSKTTEKVKKRCIELLYCWNKGLPHEPKIADAYKMLKQQGIVKEDPVYMDKASENIPKPTEEERRAAFEDEEKSKLLAKLLKSKNPDDLQAANRLIKNMVKQDTERMEKVSRRINELETIKANLKLLGEMVSQYNSQTTTASEKEMMKELFESLEKLRPKLFRLASETDENDTDGMNAILKANDEVSYVMNQYKTIVEGVQTNGQAEHNKDDEVVDVTVEDGLKSPGDVTPAPQSVANNSDNLLTDLDAIFSATSMPKQTAPTAMNTFASSHPVSYQMGGFPAMGQMGPAPAYNMSMAQTTLSTSQPYATMGMGIPQQQAMLNNSVERSSLAQPNTHAKSQSPLSHKAVEPQMSEPQKRAMFDLDNLGQSLMQQSLSDTTTKLPFIPAPKGPPPKVSLNQMTSSPATQPVAPPQAVPANHPPPVSSVSGSTTTTLSSTGTPKQAEVQPLTDILVPLETVQPGTLPPITAYDKNCLKIIIHIAKNKPRDDVSVMVISVMSTNTVPVKGFVFQAAVPKIMKVKLQPPSGTDLPAYNPILPATAITQVMLLANPQKEKVRLKYKITCNIEDKAISDVGDIEAFTVQ